MDYLCLLTPAELEDYLRTEEYLHKCGHEYNECSDNSYGFDSEGNFINFKQDLEVQIFNCYATLGHYMRLIEERILDLGHA